MRSLRLVVIDPRVRRHLPAALLTGPLLGGAHEASANSLMSKPFRHEPPFHEADRAVGVAPIRVGTQADLKKPG